jgi:hypothetical protein
MKGFDRHDFDLAQCRQELGELKQLLESSDELGENAHILPFFRQRRNLSAFVGSYNTNIARFDLVAFEYDVFGDFVADLVVGDSRKSAFNFVEFEDAGPKSLFVKKPNKATREWSPRFEHGCGQIIDWFYKLNDRRNSDDCKTRFGKRSIDFIGTLIIGRDQHIDEGERLRLDWRRENVIVNSKQVLCITFDQLLYDLQDRLRLYTGAAQVDG